MQDSNLAVELSIEASHDFELQMKLRNWSGQECSGSSLGRVKAEPVENRAELSKLAGWTWPRPDFCELKLEVFQA